MQFFNLQFLPGLNKGQHGLRHAIRIGKRVRTTLLMCRFFGRTHCQKRPLQATPYVPVRDLYSQRQPAAAEKKVRSRLQLLQLRQIGNIRKSIPQGQPSADLDLPETAIFHCKSNEWYFSYFRAMPRCDDCYFLKSLVYNDDRYPKPTSG